MSPWVEPSPATRVLVEVLQRRGVGPAKARELVRRARGGDPLSVASGVLPPMTDDEAATARAAAAAIVKRCAELGIAIVGLSDDAYPRRLAAIPDPPPVIYIRGPVDLLHQPCVAVVGTREASQAGLHAASAIAEKLVRSGVTVVSGLALGIDAAAHRGALAGNGKTIAVLAHGLHMIAPSTNRDLGYRILDTGGALVSEHPPDVPPRPPEFVRRNRMQSGLSFASIVVESGVEGGAIHQAKFTVDQGRQLWVVLSRDPKGSDLREDGARSLMQRLKARALTGTGDMQELLAGNAQPRTDAGAEGTQQVELWKA